MSLLARRLQMTGPPAESGFAYEFATANNSPIPKPTGVVEGTMLVALLSGSWGSDAPVMPSGWTSRQKNNTGTTSLHAWGEIATKVAGSSEPAEYDFQATNWFRGMIVAVNGHGGLTDWGGTADASLTMTVPSVDGAAGGLYLGQVGVRTATFATWPADIDILEKIDGSRGRIKWAESLDAGGATGTRTVTVEGGITVADSRHIAQAITLAPA